MLLLALNNKCVAVIHNDGNCWKVTLKMKVRDHFCGLLIVQGVIMTNEGHLRLDGGKSGNAVTVFMSSHQNSESAEASRLHF